MDEFYTWTFFSVGYRYCLTEYYILENLTVMLFKETAVLRDVTYHMVSIVTTAVRYTGKVLRE